MFTIINKYTSMRFANYIAFVLLSFTAISCVNSSNTSHTGPEYTSAYVCPMHCKGSGSDAPGECPTCGMDYVLNEETTPAGEEENHDHIDHSDHDH